MEGKKGRIRRDETKGRIFKGEKEKREIKKREYTEKWSAQNTCMPFTKERKTRKGKKKKRKNITV